jgi:hypothetical protein
MIGAIGRVCANDHLAGLVFDPRFEEKVSPKRRVVEMTSVTRLDVYMPMPLTKIQQIGGDVSAKERKFQIHLDMYDEALPVNILVPFNRMRLLTEVLEDVDTPQEVRDTLVQKAVEADCEREDLVVVGDDDADVLDPRRILDREEDGFVDDPENEDTGSEGEEENGDVDESSVDEEISDNYSDIESIDEGEDVDNDDDDIEGAHIDRED